MDSEQNKQMEAKAIGVRLKQWRKFLGHKDQVAFAELTGLHVSALKKYEAGINIPGGLTLSAFASTGLNLNWLLTGEGEMAAHSEKRQIPHELEEHDERLQAILGLLSSMDSPKRDDTIEEFYKRIQETQRIEDMEKTIVELKKLYKTGG